MQSVCLWSLLNSICLPLHKQRSQNRPPQKLDFALNNFPPLPGSDGAQAVPPPAPPPPALPDERASNLADIVKGRKTKDGASVSEKSMSAPATPTSVPVVMSSNGTSSTPSISKPVPAPIQQTLQITPPQSPVPPPSPPPASLPPALSATSVQSQLPKPQRTGEKASVTPAQCPGISCLTSDRYL